MFLEATIAYILLYRGGELMTIYYDDKEFDNDKDAAMYFKSCDYPNIMFNMRKGKNVREAIWNLVKRNRKC